MTNEPAEPSNPLQIRTPCPKTWGELEGDGAKRFCSQCALHVHDASQLTRAEAEELVAGAHERVCMRMKLDPHGAPIFLDSPQHEPSLAARVARWALPAAAGLLAACQPAETVEAPPDGGLDPESNQSTTIMGEVGEIEWLGDVAVPAPEELGQAAAPEPGEEHEKLGKVAPASLESLGRVAGSDI